MLFITGTLWGCVEARPGKQGLMAVVSHTAGVGLLCNGGISNSHWGSLSLQGGLRSCFSGVPLVVCD